MARIWKAFGLKPWQIDTFKLSTDPLFVDKIRDIVGLYMNPPDHAVVVCVDEKTSVQALDRTQPVLPLLPGTPERMSHDYVRHGTIDLYAALNLATGVVTHQLTARHRAVEFQKFLNLIDRNTPAGLTVHVVLDNSSTHKTPSIQRWLLRHPRFEFHFTPTSSSWMNLVERWFAEITNKWLRRGTHRSIKELAASITHWVGTWNDDPAPTCGTRPQTRSSTASPNIATNLRIGTLLHLRTRRTATRTNKHHHRRRHLVPPRPTRLHPNTHQHQRHRRRHRHLQPLRHHHRHHRHYHPPRIHRRLLRPRNRPHLPDQPLLRPHHRTIPLDRPDRVGSPKRHTRTHRTIPSTTPTQAA